MGWATGDEPKKEAISVQLVKVRSEMYRLGHMINDIQHSEKRQALHAGAEEASHVLDTIERTLNR